jgi:hypothetical protein
MAASEYVYQAFRPCFVMKPVFNPERRGPSAEHRQLSTAETAQDHRSPDLSCVSEALLARLIHLIPLWICACHSNQLTAQT